LSRENERRDSGKRENRKPEGEVQSSRWWFQRFGHPPAYAALTRVRQTRIEEYERLEKEYEEDDSEEVNRFPNLCDV
jgi:hypothetical protein